jgi:tape measure domain-containing protein
MELDIDIMGKLDPSVMATINRVKSALESMGADARTRNEVMKRAYSQMFDTVKAGAKNVETAHRSVFQNITSLAMKSAGKVHEKFVDTFKDIGKEVAKGAVFGVGFEAAGLAGRAVEGGKEFAGEAVSMRAERESMQAQMETILKSRGQMAAFDSIDMMLRNLEGRRIPERYNQMLEASIQLMASAPGKFENVDKLRDMLTKLGDVSRTPEAFSLATQAFSRMLAEGKVDAQHLRELAIDTGYNFRGAMADALKVTPDELTDLMKKHKLTAEQTMQGLFGAIDAITGPGGPAYQHGLAQLKGLKGMFTIWGGHMDDLQESFGRQMENVISPVMTTLFEHLTPAELTHAFDKWTPMMKGFGDSIAYLMESITKGPSAADIKGIGDAFKSLFGQIFGTGGAAMFRTVQGGPGGVETMQVMNTQWKAALDKWASRIEKVLADIEHTVQFISDHWNTIKDGMLLAATAWAGMKAYDFAKSIAGFLKEVGLMNVTAGVVNVTGGLPGGKAVGEAEKVAGKLAPAAGAAEAGGALAAVGAAAAPALAVAGATVLGVNLIYAGLPKIPEAAKYDPEVLAEKRRLAAEAQSRMDVMEAERKAGMGGAEGDYKAALAALTQARTALAAEMKKAQTAQAALPPGAAPTVLPPIPMAPVPKAAPPPRLPPVPSAPPPVAVPKAPLAVTPPVAIPKAAPAVLPQAPAAAPLLNLSGQTASITSSLDSFSSALADAPGKAQEASGHLGSVASIFSGLPGQASSISASLGSLVAAINSAASSAAAQIHAAGAAAAASLTV